MTVGMPDWAAEIPAAPGIKSYGQSQQMRPFTQQQLLEMGREFLEQFLRRVVQAVVGFFIPGGGPAFDQLKAYFDNIGSEIVVKIDELSGLNFGSIDAFLASLEDGKGIDLVAVPKLVRALQGIDLNGDPGAVLRQIVAVLASIPASLLYQVSLGSIADTSPNLLPDGGFDDPITLDTGTGFVHDATFGRSSPLGSAKLTTSGADRVLRSKRVPVGPKQKLTVGAWAAYQDLLTSGTGAIRVELCCYSAGVQVSVEPIGAVGAVSGTRAGWDLLLSGSWTVPDASTVDEVAVQLHVTTAATSGTVWFDDVTLRKTQKLPMGWTEGLVKRWEQIASFAGITDTDLDGDIDVIDVWNTLWSGRLKALNWIPNFSQETVDWINAGFSSAGELLDEGLNQTIVGGIISELLGQGTRTASLVAKQEARLRAIESAGNAVTDDFERGSSSGMGAAYAAYHSSGGGSGGPGTNGKGDAVYKPSGISNRVAVVRHTGAITTDACRLVVLLSSTPPSTWPDDAYSYAGFSAHDSSVTYGRLRIGGSSVRLQAVVAGAVYDLFTWSVDLKAGNTVEVQRGAAGGTDMHTYRLWVNGVERTPEAPFTDPNSRIPYGAGRRSMALGFETSLRIGLIPSQWIPAGFAYMQLQEVI